ncbi:hypothetical protein E3Q05_03812 [Wallemia mellicola]|nr:hypothetical protein E3Q05_03812 [Wallemia mellicola]
MFRNALALSALYAFFRPHLSTYLRYSCGWLSPSKLEETQNIKTFYDISQETLATDSMQHSNFLALRSISSSSSSSSSSWPPISQEQIFGAH